MAHDELQIQLDRRSKSSKNHPHNLIRKLVGYVSGHTIISSDM
jgi:hypothetical protein